MRRLTCILVILLLLSGCTRTVYQDREVVRHDSIYVTAQSVDTILQRDSVHVLERGDTVRITEYKYIYKIRERVDTSYIIVSDTVTKTVTKEVVGKGKIIEQIKSGIIFSLAIGMVVLSSLLLIKRRCS